MGGCVSWPSPRQPVSDLHPVGTPPILVIGNTGDPNTPLINARHLAPVFPNGEHGHLEGLGPHLAAQRRLATPACNRLVATYLIVGGRPHPGTVCG